MSTGSDGWPVEVRSGSAAELHGATLPEEPVRAVWHLEVTGPAVVLGSTQADGVVDHDRAKAAGVEVARRRSGGGAVWLAPGAVTWVDVLLPADDPRWQADVGRSMRWMGEVWLDAVGALGVAGAAVHHGPMVRNRWSDAVCFGGLGPGEVTVGGRKLVGISQRRTRHLARYQCALLHRWDPSQLLDVLALDPGDRAEAGRDLAEAGIGLAAAGGAGVGTDVVAALVAALERTIDGSVEQVIDPSSPD